MIIDESGELQLQINELPVGGTLVFDKDWNCNSTILINKPMTLDFNGFTLRAITDLAETIDGTSTARLNRRARAQIRIKDAEQVTLLRPHIIGAHPNGGMSAEAYDPATEAQHGIDILSSFDVNVIGGEVSDVWGDFVYVGKGSSRITVDGLKGRRNGRQGFGMASGSDVWLKNLDFDQVRRAMIDLEPNTLAESVQRVLIENCKFGESRLLVLAASGAGGHIGDVTLRDLDIVMPFRSTIGHTLREGRGPFHLQNIKVQKWHGSPLQSAFGITNANNILVENCHIPLQPARDMKFIRTYGNCSNIVVINCEFPNATAVVHQDSGPVMSVGNSTGPDLTKKPIQSF
jgi:hypothetical protein